MICGTALCSIALFVSSFVNNLHLLYFTYGIVFGVGHNFIYTSAILVVPEYFSKWRSYALIMVATGNTVGVLVYGLCLQILLDSVGWRGTFRIVGGVVTMTGLILGSMYAPNRIDLTKKCDPSSVDKASGKFKEAFHRPGKSGKSPKSLESWNNCNSTCDGNNSNLNNNGIKNDKFVTGSGELVDVGSNLTLWGFSHSSLSHLSLPYLIHTKKAIK